jgi:tripartite-type tricarboxylate transporter receptor subunit TctC
MKFYAYLFFVVCSLASSAWAAQPIKIISSFPAGSGPDVFSRQIANQMAATLKTPVIVINRPGGNGTVAMIHALNEKDPENIVLFASNDNLVVYPLLVNDSQLVDQFVPLKEALWSELVLATGPSINSIDKIFQANRISYGSWGVGSAPHLMGSELSNRNNHKDSMHVPYRDYSAWFSDINSGILTFSFVTVASTESLKQAGRIKYHAVVAPTRNPRYPNLPTLQELTGQSLTLIGWAGFYTSNNMSPSRAQQLKTLFDQAYSSKEVQEQAKTLNYNFRNLSTDEFRRAVVQDQTNYKQIIKKYNIKID